jgi:hypothetical protein
MGCSDLKDGSELHEAQPGTARVGGDEDVETKSPDDFALGPGRLDDGGPSPLAFSRSPIRAPGAAGHSDMLRLLGRDELIESIAACAGQGLGKVICWCRGRSRWPWARRGRC